LIGGLALAIDVGMASAVVGPPVLSVNVTNTPTNPVPVTVVANAAAFQPFTIRGAAESPLDFVVPSGKMLVIETVTGKILVTGGQVEWPSMRLSLSTPVGSDAAFSVVPQGKGNQNSDVYIGSHSTKIYVLPGTAVQLGVLNPKVGGSFFISGHYVDYTP
jgi:hypothetical protein